MNLVRDIVEANHWGELEFSWFSANEHNKVGIGFSFVGVRTSKHGSFRFKVAENISVNEAKFKMWGIIYKLITNNKMTFEETILIQ